MTNKEIICNYPCFDIREELLSDRSDFTMSITMDVYESTTRKIKDTIIECGMGLEGLFSENGPGQQEINIRYSDILNNSDKHCFLKQCVKNICYQNGYGCTFMAKPLIDKSGSSFHFHISLYDNLTVENLFISKGNEIYEIKNYKLSNNIIYFIGGIMKYNEEFFIIFAPYVNSYKRFKKNSFVPYSINTWSIENRFSTVRICGDDKDPHLERRISSADALILILYTLLYLIWDWKV
jgi:glutamine synthetase